MPARTGLLCVVFDFFFFKQKTAYEMRISDWSSDVCSSDLPRAIAAPTAVGVRHDGRFRSSQGFLQLPAPQHACSATRLFRNTQGKHHVRIRVQAALPRHRAGAGRRAAGVAASRAAGRCVHTRLRSEEHTSELQSLMRISYAVFCLKKKKNNPTT